MTKREEQKYVELIPQEQKELVIKRLQGRGALVPCSRCGSGELILEDGYFHLVVQSDLHNISIADGSPAIPLIAIVCRNCGAIYLHTLIALGVFDNAVDEKDNETLDKK